VHKVGFSLHDYIEMHGERNTKKYFYFISCVYLREKECTLYMGKQTKFVYDCIRGIQTALKPNITLCIKYDLLSHFDLFLQISIKHRRDNTIAK